MKYKVIDLFAGAGGFGLGFHLAELNVKLSIEKDDWAIKTLKTNQYNSQKIIHADIKKYKTDKEIKKACPFSPEIVIGGPPCQGFSIAAIRNRQLDDKRNNLFKYFAKWVKYLEPMVFVMENVRGILSWRNKSGEKIIDVIQRTFEKLGYKVEIWILNAAEFGVPQSRERVFIVGNKFNKIIGVPQKTHYINSDKKNGLKKYITVWQALSDLPAIEAGQGIENQKYQNEAKSIYQKLIRKDSSSLYNHVSMKHTKRLVERFKRIQNGKSISKVPKKFKVKKRNGNGELSDVEFNSNYRHLKKQSISYTIPAHFYSSFIHPVKPRNITAREAARIQSFPDWYKFMGKRTVISSKLLKRLGKHEDNYLSQYNQIGNAVPPLLGKAIAEHIKIFLDENKKK